MRKKPVKFKALILGMTANGLSVARSLGRKGVLAIGMDCDKRRTGMYSSYVKPVVCPNVVEDESGFIQFLIKFGEKAKEKLVLFVTSDEYIAVVSKNREIFKKYFIFTYPNQELVDSFLDKEKTSDLASKFNILHPATHTINDKSEFESVLSKIKYPCIVKPKFPHLWVRKYSGGRKVFVINDKKQLENVFNDVKGNCIEAIIQEIIPGKDKNVYVFMAYVNKEQKILGYCCCRKLIQYPPSFGIGALVESINNKDVVNAGMSILEKTKYVGLIGIEFKVNPDTGVPFFLEANLRTCFVGEICRASDVDLPYIYYCDQIGDFQEDKDLGFKEGVKLMNLELGLGSFLRMHKKKEITLKQWLDFYKAKKVVFTYFAMDDLLPWVVVCLCFLKMILKKIISIFLSFLKVQKD